MSDPIPVSSWKAKLTSTEFWFSIIAIIVGLLMGAGVFGDGTIYAKVGGWIIAALGSAGYSVARSLAKAGEGTGKAGWKTTEFWKAAVTAALIWAQAHVVPDGSKWAELIGYALTVLPAGAYAAARGVVKGPPGVQVLVNGDEGSVSAN